MKKVIITGSPGTGKSTLLRELSQQFEVAEEVSRSLIRSSQNSGQHISPWGNVEKFAELALERMIYQCSQQKSACCIFDRSIPDVIVALRHRGKRVDPVFLHAVKKHLSGSLVFFAPPWEDIYVRDAQRPESFEKTLPISDLTKKVYRGLGFELMELKKETPAQRAAQMIKTISLLNL